MITNTYLPHVGGVANSVYTFSEAYRDMGHHVTIIAPEFENMPDEEEDVIRVPAFQNFNGSDFSVSIALTPVLIHKAKKFRPDIIHSHHPFLLGDTALRMSATLGTPLVFTYHTMYEFYTHYVPADSVPIRRFARRLAVEYCNLCDHVIAPSKSILEILLNRGVTTPITDLPTGIDIDRFAGGDGECFRKQHGLSPDLILAGHVGRLAPEKNCGFLADAFAGFIKEDPERHIAVVIGKGPSEQEMRHTFEKAGIADRVIFTGKLTGRELADAYHAMDLFAFASKTETQGMVIAEAMAAGVPVVAMDAPGAREIVRDRENGRLVAENDLYEFIRALTWTVGLPGSDIERLRANARNSVKAVSIERCAERAIHIYETVLSGWVSPLSLENSSWNTLRERLKQEWEIWNGRITALESAITDKSDKETKPPS